MEWKRIEYFVHVVWMGYTIQSFGVDSCMLCEFPMCHHRCEKSYESQCIASFTKLQSFLLLKWMAHTRIRTHICEYKYTHSINELILNLDWDFDFPTLWMDWLEFNSNQILLRNNIYSKICTSMIWISMCDRIRMDERSKGKQSNENTISNIVCKLAR